MLCIDGLIAVFVLQLMGNVGGKGHLAELIEDFLKNSFIGKLDQTVSLFHYIHNGPLQYTVAKPDYRSRLCLFSRLYKGFPDIVFLSL